MLWYLAAGLEVAALCLRRMVVSGRGEEMRFKGEEEGDGEDWEGLLRGTERLPSGLRVLLWSLTGRKREGEGRRKTWRREGKVDPPPLTVIVLSAS